jgi:hypothetical protein
MSETQTPPVEEVLSEVVVTLALMAHSYLEPQGEAEPDLGAAEIAIDTAGAAFERVAPRLSQDQRTALTSVLTEARMTFVRKRGL